MPVITDPIVKQLHNQSQSDIADESQAEILSGTVVDEPTQAHSAPKAKISSDATLLERVNQGEWDNLDDLTAFKALTQEGQLMIRIDAMDNRIRQLETKLPMLLNQYLNEAYIQVLKKIHALRKTKAAIFYYFYKDSGQRDLPGN